MKKAILFISFCRLISINLYAQEHETWTSFNEEGGVKFSQETVKLLSDTSYRDTIYSMTASLLSIPELLNEQKYLLALYTLISQYDNDREKVSTVAGLLARQGIGGQHYLHAFYTYIFADPAIYHISMEGPSFLEDPMLMETKLESCKTLIAYTEDYRRALQSDQEIISSN